MNLIFRPGRLADLPAGLDSIRDRFVYTDALRPQLLALWQDIIARCAAPCIVLEDLDDTFGHRMVAFAIGAFIHDWFREHLVCADYPYLGDVLLDPAIQARSPFLTEREVCIQNSGPGLTLLTFNSGAPERILTDPDAAALRDQAGRFSHYGSAGYCLNEHLLEMHGPFGRHWGETLGFRVVREGALRAEMKEEQRPYLATMTKADADGNPGSPIAASFRYTPPKCGFTKGEQELLFWALGGLPDEELAVNLDISQAGVRKRWDSIYSRALGAGVLKDALKTGKTATAQTRQKKPRLLNYLQYHMEELRPCERKRSPRAYQKFLPYRFSESGIMNTNISETKVKRDGEDENCHEVGNGE